jgi:mannose-6-phosphate isomerase
MREILELENKVLPYAWGSRTRIAELLGQSSPAEEPQAELWMGAHPKAPSTVRIGGERRPLDRLIAERPAEILGDSLLQQCGGRLPFLLKVLAADRALSIQAHPDRAQAAAGFEREEKRGVPLEAEERNYRDRCHKPEVLYAVEPFSILRGFRRQQEILDLAAPLDLEGLLPALGALRRGEEGEGLEEFFTATLTLEGEGRLRRLNRKVVARIGERGLAEHPVYRWVLRLADQFPDDRGVIAPLFLHVLRLEPGQAIFTGPGILHAYLEGFGVELMANSDNVLRGGLTTKHVDVAELKRILRFEPQPPAILVPTTNQNGERSFVPPVDDFALTLVPLEADRPRLRKVSGVEILLVLEGEGRLESAASSHDFRRGQAFLVPANVGEYVLEGEGNLFRAEPGGTKG